MTTLENQGGRGPLFSRALVGREVRETCWLAMPIVFSQLGQVALGFTDTVMVGRLGPEALAAMAIGGGFYLVFYIFGIGVLHGVTALASQAYGARDPRGVRRFIRQGFWISVVLALPIMVLLSQSERLFVWAGQAPQTAHAAAIYVDAVKWSILPGLFYTSLRAFVGAIGRPQAMLYTAIFGVTANAILDYALVFGHFGAPAMGAYGAAVATIFVNILMFAILAVISTTWAPYRRYRVMARLWRPDWPKFVEAMRIGLPSGISVILEVAFFIGSVFLMARIGTVETAAHHIAIQTAAVTFMIPLGLSQVATIRVGHAYGRGDMHEVGIAGWVALALGVAFMAAMSVLFWTLPEAIVAIYVDAGDPANRPTIEFAVSFLAVAALFQIFDGAQIIGLGSLRGLSDTKVPMYLSALGYWVIGFSTCLLFAFTLDYGAIGIWIGLLVGLGVVAFMMLNRFYRLAHPPRARSVMTSPL
ncbi:MAG: MATE family efflux transporter [Alphaproteobacteria bacterium]|nr:MATE family efflux transporter [Alphaproteobacteria bacterium]